MAVFYFLLFQFLHKQFWINTNFVIDLNMLSPAHVGFPVRPSEYAPNAVPTWSEWKSLWAAWDVVSKTMVSRDELVSKPIKLRNALIFYLGHIPTFLGKFLMLTEENGKYTDIY